MEPDDRPRSLLADSARAHALLFESPLAPAYDAATGVRILLAFLVVGVGLFYALRLALDAAGARGMPAAGLGFVVALTAAFVLVQKSFVREPMAAIGLRPFAAWTRRERLYFFQVVPIAAVAFAIVFNDHLRMLLTKHGPAGFVLFSLCTGLVWGMVQEFLYRGWLQTELTRRFGAIIGLLLANLLFTFGPLHLNYLMAADGIRWGVLAAVFGIGLLFGIVYWRSGNLWIPAAMHGLWPPNMN
ncbi:MAG: CPBP family intramembrane metalloprotease [Betaproteobacteria bacterium]|nr:CPBP family intramembrane metalloprotease [Betaproteobacteria bacterium]